MKSKIGSILSAGILTAGLMLAQSAPAAAPKPAARVNHTYNNKKGEDWFVQRLTARLNLTADQQSRVKSILQEARAQDPTRRGKLMEERMALDDAVKTNATGQIDRIIRTNADLNTQMIVSHLKAMAQIYAVLTPQQKAKFDQAMENWMPNSAS